MEIRLQIDNSKPHLKKAMEETPTLAREVIQTFVQLMDEAFDPSKGIAWAALPQALHKDLTFTGLVNGTLRGVLDVQKVDPEVYSVLQVEVHPLAMLSPRRNVLTDEPKLRYWRDHFKLNEQSGSVSEATVSAILRRVLRYSRYIRLEELQKALEANQIATYRGIGHEQVEKLPFLPALQYQRKHLGELYVGKMFDETGFLDCGPLAEDVESCQACAYPSVHKLDAKTTVCLSCNAGFKVG